MVRFIGVVSGIGHVLEVELVMVEFKGVGNG